MLFYFLWLIAEPIKDEEFELLIKYQPCNYAKSLLAHGTSRGEPWVRYMTTLFSQHKYENMKNMEIFGNDLYLGDVDTFFSLFTDDHFPNLQSIDMSCMWEWNFFEFFLNFLWIFLWIFHWIFHWIFLWIFLSIAFHLTHSQRSQEHSHHQRDVQKGREA